MPQITFGGRTLFCEKGQTVLDAFLAAGFDVPYSCKMGSCQICLTKCVEGDVADGARVGVKDTLSLQGYFLPCLCYPKEDLCLQSSSDTDLFSSATVCAKRLLSETVCQILLEPHVPLYYHAGQFINVRNSDGLVRSYSLASVSKLDQYLELHVAKMENGRMSSWVHGGLEIGDTLDFAGPNGNCFYVSGKPEQDILLIGTGTGLAPLLGIVRDALASGHSGKLHLFHGGQKKESQYLFSEISQLADLYKNFNYYPCVSREAVSYPYKHGRADDLAFEAVPDLRGWRVFLCGSPAMVNDAKRKAFLSGANLTEIYADPFEVKELRSKERS